MAKILQVSEENIQKCAEYLRSGSLVSFPTETVYGLGADARNPRALEKIFSAKERPKSDPLIVHLGEMKSILPYVDLTERAARAFWALGTLFWPGPLTLVLKSNFVLPLLVSAQGSFVAFRIPSHPIARSLLEAGALPVAAPSANKFGHVSPTSASHVFSDLGSVDDLFILDGGPSCSVGIESTVAKIDDEGHVFILRPGAISADDIEACLKKEKIFSSVTLVERAVKEKNSSVSAEILESPGQLLTHYAPNLETFIFLDKKEGEGGITPEQCKQTVFIDFQGEKKDTQAMWLAYFDLSVHGDALEAAQNLFTLLRQAENIDGAKYILLPYLKDKKNNLLDAVFDRVFRAASGRFAKI